MTTLREAAQQSLEALGKWSIGYHVDAVQLNDLIATLEAALEQPEQEPVAWMVYTLDGKSVCVTDNPADFTDGHRALPLFTHPPRREWRSLSEEEKLQILDDTMEGGDLMDMARAIEKALKERNV